MALWHDINGNRMHTQMEHLILKFGEALATFLFSCNIFRRNTVDGNKWWLSPISLLQRYLF